MITGAIICILSIVDILQTIRLNRAEKEIAKMRNEIQSLKRIAKWYIVKGEKK